MPYYIEGISINIYSIEELCYYISGNVYLLDSDFMNEDLCQWLEKEQHLNSLAESLRNVIRERGKLSTFVDLILREVYYLNPNQIQDVMGILIQMEEKSDFECDKMRADRLMEKEKYLSSIYAYKHLLLQDDAKTCNPVVLGNIYHNLGCAYARLFLFQDAIFFFKKAYSLNEDFETLRELLFAYRCMHDEDSFMKTAIAYNLDDMTIQELKNEMAIYSRNASIVAFEDELKVHTERINKGDRTDFAKEVHRNLLEWKDEYRRICRV